MNAQLMDQARAATVRRFFLRRPAIRLCQDC